MPLNSCHSWDTWGTRQRTPRRVLETPPGHGRSAKEIDVKDSSAPYGPTVLARFWAKVDKTPTNGCWLWTAGIDRSGYGKFVNERKQLAAHRFAFQALVGPIPPGLEIDHLCHGHDDACVGGTSCLHRRCVNPAHLEAVTRQTNMLRGRTQPAANAAKSHCPQGHEYVPATTYTDPQGRRHCRPCHSAAVLRSRSRKRARASGQA